MNKRKKYRIKNGIINSISEAAKPPQKAWEHFKRKPYSMGGFNDRGERDN